MKTAALWYRKPATVWTEALPLGNGRLGAMVFGGVGHERIALNIDTLWSGERRVWDNPGARTLLPKVRSLVSEGRYREATETCKGMMGPYNESYLPLGDVELVLEHGEVASDYRRELDLGRAVSTTSYRQGAAHFLREAFVSCPDQVFVLHMSAEGPATLSFAIRFSGRLPFAVGASGGNLLMSGRAPSHAAPSYQDVESPVVYTPHEGMRFACAVSASCTGGSVALDDCAIHVRDAKDAIILLAASTSFSGFDRPADDGSIDPSREVTALLAAARARSFPELLRRHVEDHGSLFRRVTFALHGKDDQDELPTDELLAKRGAASTRLVELLFHYGRYLLIASSRPGTQPANLQGIWNEEVRPPWSSNWTININTQMNYWPAETCNLSECHGPLLAMIRELAVNGRETARVNYGCRGWVAHHNADLWRQSAPVGDWGEGDPSWALWPMGGVWLCMHLWEHYAFTGDLDYLRAEAYPTMKGAAEFCLDWLFEDREGRLVTCPSTSPEHNFRLPDGSLASVSAASTSDMSLIRGLFADCIEACRTLRVDDDFRRQLEAARDRLPPWPVGRRGRLQEWLADFDDEDEHHRHSSHLVCVHPGRQVTRGTPELFAAARRSLEIRGDGGTGWSLAWKINLWARLGDGDRARGLLGNLLVPTTAREVRTEGAGLYLNLFDAHPPFQIDGNFGATAGIAEMLLQSHEGVIRLLPALPAAWTDGEFGGLCARGGFEVDASWKGGRLAAAVVRARRAGRCRLQYGERSVELDAAPGVAYAFSPDLRRRRP